MILSERAAIMDDAMGTLKAGDVVEATVRNLVPYGAFVSIKNPQSGELTGGHVSALLLYIICHFRSLCSLHNAVEAFSLAFTIAERSRHNCVEACQPGVLLLCSLSAKHMLNHTPSLHAPSYHCRD